MPHECTECTFVANKESIYVHPDVLKKLGKRPVFLGIFTLPGWVGHSAFYVLKCSECDNAVVDYPHGYTSEGRLFFSCNSCFDGEQTIIPINDSGIYIKAGQDESLSFMASILGAFKLFKANKLQSKGKV